MSSARFTRLLGLVLVFSCVALLSIPAFPQATISTGAIAGTVSDPSGAVVMGAKIAITSKATGGQITLQSTGTGAFNSGALIPGNYVVRISQTGFKTTDVPVTVQVGSVTTVDLKLQVGAMEEVVEVSAAAVTVNTEQAVVQGVLTTQQIDSLPINGRNFLDLAQLEPGVQIQDAMNFDPTKGGFTGISVGGRTGRTTRIELDGQDISDETVGTTVANVSQSAIQEFSISQSSLDLSTELTSSGAVNVVSRSGTNNYHGEAFYLFRGDQLAANFPGPDGGVNLPYQRNHLGGRFGGPILKDKLFFFLNYEHVKQDLASPISVAVPEELRYLTGSLPTPFRETMSLARLDWQAKPNLRLFYRLNYDNNKGVTNYGYGYSAYSNNNNTPSHQWGADFSTGQWAHSLRVGYQKFVNGIGNASAPNVLVPGVEMRVSQLWTGPNLLAPQATLQQNEQVKYDGSRMWGSHNLRYGVGFNRIRGGGYASFYGLAPYMSGRASTPGIAFATDSCDTVLGGLSTNATYASITGGADASDGLTPCFPGGSSNPLNYGLSALVIGNGLGFATEMPAFGYPAGGQWDNRFQAYFGDSWKFKPFLTISAGFRYVRDTGRTNSDIDPVPCSDIAADLIAAATAGGHPITSCPAGGYIMDMFGANLGGRVRQDNNNFGPSLGFAWDVFKNGKTVVRGGAGMFFENAIFNNVLFSRPAYMKTGLFNTYQAPCPSGNVDLPSGTVNYPYCGQAMGLGAAAAITLQSQYQTESMAAGPTSNPQFIGNHLAPADYSESLLAPNYRSPYSYQMNIGVQHQLWEGTVLTADFVRNVNLHYLIRIDTNHVGDSRYLDTAAAQDAIDATNASVGCGPGIAGINCALALPAASRPTMEDYAYNGLASGYDIGSGLPWYSAGVRYAFPGINSDVGANDMMFPGGRSVYNALQLSLRSNKQNPVSFIKALNLQASYTLSRFSSMSPDQDFIPAVNDQRDPLKYFGPAAFDRTHQFSVGLAVEFPKFFRFSLIQHLGSPLPNTLRLPNNGNYGEIFYSDLTGDGTNGDILPGTNFGSFQRSIDGSSLAQVIDHYNSTTAGTLTPAGQALVDAGLMTEAQLIALGGVAASIDTTGFNPDYVAEDWINTTDIRLGFPIKIKEHLTIEPTVSLYNLFNVANFNPDPGSRIGGTLDGSGLGWVGPADRYAYQAFQTPGLYNYASPRQAEFSLRITF